MLARTPRLGIFKGLLPLSAFMLAATTASADDQPPARLVEAYDACATHAARSVLSAEQAELCSGIYMRIKLHFLGLSLGTYLAMSAGERAEANRKGYELYRDWR